MLKIGALSLHSLKYFELFFDRLGNDIADVFSAPLLVYFLLTNLLLCILGYEILLVTIFLIYYHYYY